MFEVSFVGEFPESRTENHATATARNDTKSNTNYFKRFLWRKPRLDLCRLIYSYFIFNNVKAVKSKNIGLFLISLKIIAC